MLNNILAKQEGIYLSMPSLSRYLVTTNPSHTAPNPASTYIDSISSASCTLFSTNYAQVIISEHNVWFRSLLGFQSSVIT